MVKTNDPQRSLRWSSYNNLKYGRPYLAYHLTYRSDTSAFLIAMHSDGFRRGITNPHTLDMDFFQIEQYHT